MIIKVMQIVDVDTFHTKAHANMPNHGRERVCVCVIAVVVFLHCNGSLQTHNLPA